MATASPDAKLATYRANCAGYGYTPGTPEMAHCVQQEAGDHRGMASANMAAMAETMGEMSAPRRPVTTTNCTRFGDSVNCTSY